MSESSKKHRSRRPRSGRNVLLVVGMLLVGSAVTRLASGSGGAVAFEAFANANPSQQTIEDAAAPVTSEQLAVLLEQLQRREIELTEKERLAETRIAAAELAESRVASALRELERAERDLRATITIADQAAENDLIQLTAVYENMKPQQAAPLFAQMSPNFAAGFLGRMRPDMAAAIMAGLQPEVAYAISVILAGRNADVPRSNTE